MIGDIGLILMVAGLFVLFGNKKAVVAVSTNTVPESYDVPDGTRCTMQGGRWSSDRDGPCCADCNDCDLLSIPKCRTDKITKHSNCPPFCNVKFAPAIC